MKILLRRLRGALGIGSIWGVAFGGVGGLLGALIPTTSFLSTTLGLGIVAGSSGFVLGTAFAVLLSAMEGRRTLGELSRRRAALWGFIAGTAFAFVGSVAVGGLLDVVGLAENLLGLSIPVALQLTAVAVGAISYGAVAAGLAAATIALAKRSPSALESGPSGSAPDLLGR